MLYCTTTISTGVEAGSKVGSTGQIAVASGRQSRTFVPHSKSTERGSDKIRGGPCRKAVEQSADGGSRETTARRGGGAPFRTRTSIGHDEIGIDDACCLAPRSAGDLAQRLLLLLNRYLGRQTTVLFIVELVTK